MTRNVIVALVLLATPASAHDWYSLACCHEQDCAPIPLGAVSHRGSDVIVTLEAGDHPMINSGSFSQKLSGDDPKIKQSQDGDYHACILPTDGGVYLRCLYTPVLGF